MQFQGLHFLLGIIRKEFFSLLDAKGFFKTIPALQGKNSWF